MVTAGDIQSLAQRIAEQYQPERIILFGSHARGDAREDSDVDLLVLLPLRTSHFRDAVEILNATGPRFAVDLIVRSPEDAQQRYEQGDPLMREAFDRGRVIYEKAA
jgi:uncharacterized protein